jgi:aspartyl-tRNA(Asn)/glutamyl-tRNA(Gln) amidotransferase subunit A
MSTLIQDPGRVRALAADIAALRLTASELVERCLARIAEVDGLVHAWKIVLADEARSAANVLDAEARAGQLRGPLHGIPVGVKDVIDVAGVPTRANCAARAELPPATADATVVAHLRAAGAIVLGKTHTTELAFFESVPPTRNPHDVSRTPGGSSAGSGAAVAAGMVPLALGTQTAGSVNRPAAYCGIGAFKPSTLAIGGVGMVPLSPSFDTVGAFGFSAADAVALAAGFAAAHLRIGSGSASGSRIVVLQDASIARLADAETLASVGIFAERLAASGLPVEQRASPIAMDDVRAEHRVTLLAELGRTHGRLSAELLAPRLAADIVAGLAIPDGEYHRALRALATLRANFWSAFGPADILLWPAAPTVAPRGMATGDPSFVTPATAFGGPVVSARAGLGKVSGMPVGALLTAAPGCDARLAAFVLEAAERGLEL